MTNTSILGYFGVRNSFLTINLKISHAINVISKMAALNLHNGMSSVGICVSVALIKVIIINNFSLGGQINKFSLAAALVTLDKFL